MLHTYAFKNFESFAKRTEVSLRLSDKAASRGWEVTPKSGQRLSTVLGVMGANGAGKTRVLKPLAFAAWFMSRSFQSKPDAPLPLEPHFAHEAEPTEIEVEAEDVEGTLWRYELHATAQRVIFEALYRKQTRFNYVFTRELDAQDGYKVRQQGFGMPPAEAARVRPNASLVSTARQYGVEMAEHITDFNLNTNIDARGGSRFHSSQLTSAAQVFASEQRLYLQMSSLIQDWDLGLTDVELRRFEQTDPADGSKSEQWLPFGVHAKPDGQLHRLNFHQESSGTQAAFVLLSRLLPLLNTGGVALIDELDADLHPHMLEPLLSLFASPVTNPHQAQLLFSLHAPHVLTILSKAQMLFVEKRDCVSQAYRGDSIKGLRSDDNLYAKYMAGALGAVPQL
jgi:hypothetical protein